VRAAADAEHRIVLCSTRGSLAALELAFAEMNEMDSPLAKPDSPRGACLQIFSFFNFRCPMFVLPVTGSTTTSGDASERRILVALCLGGVDEEKDDGRSRPCKGRKGGE
jgi:hypothetical protein